MIDDANVPDDQNPCTNDLCTAGVPSHTPVTTGAACGSGMVCDGSGHCIGCNKATDCAGQDTDCKTRTCTAGVCGFSFAAAGSVTTSQTPGNCHQNQCDGAGNIVSAIDNANTPAGNGNQCTGATCAGGTPTFPNVPQGTPCNQNGGTKCDSNGNCVQCLAQADCGASTACQTHACVAGVCGTVNASPGTVVSNPVPGDCRSDQCDGNGNVLTNVPDSTDVPPDDGNQCTGETCIAGTPQHPDKPQGSACNQNGGNICNGSGACVTCLAASDCGTNTACQTFTCTGGVCNATDAAAGTVVSNPVPGDCRSDQCDGSGNILTNAPDDTDVPPSNGNQCTGESCSAGAPAFPPLGQGTACNQNGGSQCDGNGNCVQCLAPSDCGSDTTCQKHTCTAGACGVSDPAAGTFVSDPTPGDCHSNQCDGQGGIVYGIDDSDLPVDANACTEATCTAGVPSTPPLPAGTACGQNGGTECDGVGDCVQCVNDSECPPTGNECTVPACNAGLCGAKDVAAGTPAATQTTGDCQQIQCDGMGGTTSVADDTDVPPSNGNQCASATCNAGVPAFPADAAGTPCSTNGGTLCDDTGTCTNAVQVVRVGDGTAVVDGGSPALSSAATAVFLEERFVSDGALVPTGHNPLALPTTASGNNARLTTSGSATSEGALALSVDGHYVTLAGYDAALGTASVASTASSMTNRVVGRVDASGNVDTSTKITTLISANNARSAVTIDGTSFWVGGAVNGIVYIAHGATGGETSILASPPNVRVVNIFAGQLYGSSGSKNFTNVFTVASSTPASTVPTTSATETPLPGMPTTGTVASPYAYALVGGNVLYVADDGTSTAIGGVQKWTLNGSTWTLATTFTSAGAVRGVTAFVTGSTTTVVATTGAVTSANTLVTFVDNGVNLNPAATVIATAATNTAFRGVAPAPR